MIVEHAAGLTWLEEGEQLQRAAHALRDGERVWLVDPFEDEAALERAQALGPIAGVLQLLDRHNRDGAAIAGRLGVAVLRLPDTLPGSDFEVLTAVNLPKWRERALWDPQRRVLVVAEALGTVGSFRLGPAAVGVHPMVRPAGVPNTLRARSPELLLCGHGAPLDRDAGPAIEQAAGAARRDALLAPLRMLRERLSA